MATWKVNAIRHVFFYAFDMCIAIAGWTYAFGLHVKNWWALIGLLVFSRFVFHTLTMAFMKHAAQAFAQQSSGDAKAGNP
jgi:hypothetical protein